ncbi:hypothetical protein B0G57_102200 [Trinickia symbiotica]|nr:hypothetical protein B0G57_102200 [Trinickia symbiotica]
MVLTDSIDFTGWNSKPTNAVIKTLISSRHTAS